MKITVNGEVKEVGSKITLLEYLHNVGLNVQAVACDLNGGIVKRRDFSSTNISDGDMLEIVNFVGGGTRDAKGRGTRRDEGRRDTKDEGRGTKKQSRTLRPSSE